jgi:peptidoglycan hydrolase-like protein with peptidoglycan-binding domain
MASTPAPAARAPWPSKPQGEDVEGLQRILVGAGLLPASGVDGEFGPQTKAAVIALQRQLGVTADGIVEPVVGPQTWGALG